MLACVNVEQSFGMPLLQQSDRVHERMFDQRTGLQDDDNTSQAVILFSPFVLYVWETFIL